MYIEAVRVDDMRVTIRSTAWVRANLREVVDAARAGEVTAFGPYRTAIAALTQPPLALTATQMRGTLAVMADTCGYVLANPTGSTPQLPSQAHPLIRHLWDTDPTHQYLSGFADLVVQTLAIQGGPTDLVERENIVAAAIAEVTGDDYDRTTMALYGDRTPTTTSQERTV